MVDYGLELYMREVNRFPLLKPQEELDLARRMRSGDLAARDELIRRNLRLVVSIAKNYRRTGVGLLDLIEEGNVGLVRAVERYDPTRGVRFSTYAFPCIRQSVRRGLAKAARPISVPLGVAALVAEYQRTARKLEAESGWPPTRDQIGRALGLTSRKAHVIARAAGLLAARPMTPCEDSDRSPWAFLPDPDAEPASETVSRDRRADRVQESLRTVDDRAAMILRMRFGLGGYEPMTLREVGRRIGLTRERVRQIEHKALARLGQDIHLQDTDSTPGGGRA